MSGSLGQEQATVEEREARVFLHTYKRLPIDIERGDGPYLYGKDGKQYLDMFGGIAVNALGYRHPAVTKAIHAQVDRFLHVSNMFFQDTQLALAERLTAASGFPRVFFTNSGTEAMEGALKLVRKWGVKGRRKNIFGLSDSFHGRTLGSLSITGRDKYRDGYAPFLPGTSILRFNDADALRSAVNEDTLAVVLEFIQGEGGINVVSGEYVRTLQELRDTFGFLVVADEIQSGVGRTGRFFAFEHFPFRPDIVVCAKAIGGGLPLGALLVSAPLDEVFTPGVHGTTFGGNPVSCAAGHAALGEILEGGLMKNAERVGSYLEQSLRSVQNEFPDVVAEVRGMGLMLGLEMRQDATGLVDGLRDAGVLVLQTNTTVLRWLPPLIINDTHVDTAIRSLRETITAVYRTHVHA